MVWHEVGVELPYAAFDVLQEVVERSRRAKVNTSATP